MSSMPASVWTSIPMFFFPRLECSRRTCTLSSGWCAWRRSRSKSLSSTPTGEEGVGIDVQTDAGVELIYKLAETSDVFLTNKLPAVRKRLRIEARGHPAHNPNIIYVSGTGSGERGPDADRGGYDFLSFWCRGTSAMGRHHGCRISGGQPTPGYGDSIGGMTIAGGILGALFHRERTGEAKTVDVSLLGVGMWAMSPAIALSLQLDHAWRPDQGGADGTVQSARRHYRTQDGRFLAFSCLQGFHYWPGACRVIGREDLIDDPALRDARAVGRARGMRHARSWPRFSWLPR